MVKSICCLPFYFLSFNNFCKHLFIQEVLVTMKKIVEKNNFLLFSVLMKNPIYSQNSHPIFKVPLFSTLCSLSTMFETGTYGPVSQIPSFTHSFNIMPLKNIPRTLCTSSQHHFCSVPSNFTCYPPSLLLVLAMHPSKGPLESAAS